VLMYSWIRLCRSPLDQSRSRRPLASPGGRWGCGAWTPASPLRATVELGGYDRQRTMIARVRPLHPEGP
jgi:hypothetical protein